MLILYLLRFNLNIFYTLRDGRDASSLAYSLLGYIFNSIYGETMPEIKKTPNGKPYFPSLPHIHFSLSHCATHVLCVVSDFPVGCDIESPRNISESAIRYFCSPEEALQFDPLDLWVLKESYIKLIGGRLPLVNSIRFTIEKGVIITPEKLSTSKLYRIDDCSAAVSTFGGYLPDSANHIHGSNDP